MQEKLKANLRDQPLKDVVIADHGVVPREPFNIERD